MNKMIALLLLVSSYTYAQEEAIELNQNVEETTTMAVKQMEPANWEVALGYTTSNLEQDSNENFSIDGRGILLTFGRNFQLMDSLKTTSSFVGNFVSMDENDANISNNGSLERMDYGLAQKISYNFNALLGLNVEPYLQAGVSRGNYSAEEVFGNTSFELSRGYLSYGGAVGIMVPTEGGFAPFLQYSYRKVDFDSDAEVNGVQFETINDELLTARTFVLGVGYLF